MAAGVRTSVYLPADVKAALDASPDSPAVVLRRGLALPGEHEALARVAAQAVADRIADRLLGALDTLRAGIADDVRAVVQDEVASAVRSALRDLQGGSF